MNEDLKAYADALDIDLVAQRRDAEGWSIPQEAAHYIGAIDALLAHDDLPETLASDAFRKTVAGRLSANKEPAAAYASGLKIHRKALADDLAAYREKYGTASAPKGTGPIVEGKKPIQRYAQRLVAEIDDYHQKLEKWLERETLKLAI